MPAVDWNDSQNEQAVRHLAAIKNKLNGLVGVLSRTHGGPTLPLSVEGQVRELIDLGTSSSNLSRAYVGWASHM
jgi:phosphatidylinositol kinase/protein kinase (PI-3  family)